MTYITIISNKDFKIKSINVDFNLKDRRYEPATNSNYQNFLKFCTVCKGLEKDDRSFIKLCFDEIPVFVEIYVYNDRICKYSVKPKAKYVWLLIDFEKDTPKSISGFINPELSYHEIVELNCYIP